MPIPKIGNDTTPLFVGGHYLITPGGASQQWVEIIAITKGIIYVKGLDNTIADWSLPDWHFDDVIVAYTATLVEGTILTEDGFELSTEDLFYLVIE